MVGINAPRAVGLPFGRGAFALRIAPAVLRLLLGGACASRALLGLRALAVGNRLQLPRLLGLAVGHSRVPLGLRDAGARLHAPPRLRRPALACHGHREQREQQQRHDDDDDDEPGLHVRRATRGGSGVPAL